MDATGGLPASALRIEFVTPVCGRLDDFTVFGHDTWLGLTWLGPFGAINTFCRSGDVYAIISDGSHQYRVQEGQVLEVQRKDLDADAKTIEFDRVLFVGDLEDGPKVGQPVVEGAKVTASIVRELKGDKITIQKFRRRKDYALKKGHRQKFLQVKIDKIEV